ncbi:hypothetical protein J7S33_24025, partial [Saccharothrix algeriensis]
LPQVVPTDPVFATEEVVGLTPHAIVIDPREPLVPLHQFLRRSPASTASMTTAELLRNFRWLMTFTGRA